MSQEAEPQKQRSQVEPGNEGKKLNLGTREKIISFPARDWERLRRLCLLYFVTGGRASKATFPGNEGKKLNLGTREKIISFPRERGKEVEPGNEGKNNLVPSLWLGTRERS
ncbi:MAG: hypothetical protein GDA56_03200 [Hormoscilla sp. GM7CHS1pb]|nr:hypothetical protein [Hormoscilla sp. GM7CHS1pb]